MDKDLVLDTSGVGQIYGLGPESADGHAIRHRTPIVGIHEGMPTGFPISRSLEIKNGAKTTVEKLFETTEDSSRHDNLASAEIKSIQDG